LYNKDDVVTIKYDKYERGIIHSSGYYLEENVAGICNLTFWICASLSNNQNLEEHVLKNYLNHLLQLKDNIIFDLSK
jgi:hypothetical protein